MTTAHTEMMPVSIKWILGKANIVDADDRRLAQANSKEAAEFIFRACNRDHAFDDLVKALKDAERIISTALRERQFSTDTAAQRQNKFNAEGHIDGIRAALAKAGAA